MEACREKERNDVFGFQPDAPFLAECLAYTRMYITYLSLSTSVSEYHQTEKLTCFLQEFRALMLLQEQPHLDSEIAMTCLSILSLL